MTSNEEMYNEFLNVISFDNMYTALKKSCRNVRWKTNILGYEAHGLENTYKLLNELKSGTYKPRPYKLMKIHEPKERDICCANVRDRQVDHCICDNYLYNELTRTFIYDNFACQYGKGNHKFLKRLTQHLVKYYNENKSNDGYVLTCDIHRFFLSTPHEVAKAAVRKRVRNIYISDWACDVVDSYKSVCDNNIGLYPGRQTVQLIQLAVLDDLDHFIKEKLHIKHYMRYNDDFILIHSDKEYLKYCKEQISNELTKIGLSLNDNKTKISKLSKGFKILHWTYRLKDSGKVIRYMEKSKLKAYRRKITKLMIKDSKDGGPRIHDFLLSFKNYVKQGNTTFNNYKTITRYIIKKEGDIYE